MHINERDIKEAFKNRMITERAYGYDKGLEVFFNMIEQNAYIVIIDNDGSKQYEEYKKSILYGKHDLIFENALDSVSRNNAIREFMLQNSEYFQHLEKNAAKQGCKPVTTFMASTMWENGFTVLDSNGRYCEKDLNAESAYMLFKANSKGNSESDVLDLTSGKSYGSYDKFQRLLCGAF